ncbi:hypothetical protein FRB90_009454 [Tulasnella sp. 427]|nr:hypothetical protein FRB90_009454 [Tulasnella sp. 427]
MASSEGSTSSKAETLPIIEELKKKEPLLPPHITTYFIAGGIAGAASRTVVSPLERLKIIHPPYLCLELSGDLVHPSRQVQPKRSGAGAYNGVYRSLVRMWQEEGFKGFMRGNGANCIRIIPYSAVQFTAYEQLKKFFTKNGTRELDTLTRLTAGALAGITSVTTTYPLDLVRARLSIISASLEFAHNQTPATVPSLAATAPSSSTASTAALSKIAPSTSATPRPVPLAANLSTSAASHVAAAVSGSGVTKPKLPGMWEMIVLVYKEEGGIRGLYRGLIPTAVGVAPYVGINFTAYETLRIFITPPEHKNSVPRKLLCGALAGSISQTITYPLDVLRRKMQVVGMKASSGVGSLGHKYNGAWDAIAVTIRTEGIQGMYRGLWPNLLKVAPSIATSFFTYELVKEALL